MLKRLAAAVAFLMATGLAFPVFAADPPAPCQSQGVASAAAIKVPTGQMQQDLLLGISATKVILPDVSGAVTRSISCTRGGVFKIGRDDYTLTGENSDKAPRRAIPAGASAPLFYLAPIDDLRAAVQAELDKRPAPLPVTAYALVKLDGRTITVAQLFTAIPTDDVLKSAIAALANPIRGPIAISDNGKIQLYIATPAAPSPQTSASGSPAGSTPPPGGAGVGGPTQIYEPDGVVFARQDDGGARHQPTGFVCPIAYGALSRRDMVIYDRSEGGRDVSCGYGEIGSSGWYTLYLTKIPAMSLAQVFQAYVQEAQKVTPVARTTNPPLATGPAPLPTSASFWMDPNGTEQGLWLSKIGDWHVKVRATFRPGLEKEASDTARTIFAAFYQQIRTPGAAALPP